MHRNHTSRFNVHSRLTVVLETKPGVQTFTHFGEREGTFSETNFVCFAGLLKLLQWPLLEVVFCWVESASFFFFFYYFFANSSQDFVLSFLLLSSCRTESFFPSEQCLN